MADPFARQYASNDLLPDKMGLIIKVNQSHEQGKIWIIYPGFNRAYWHKSLNNNGK
jgi:hypothetical protein